MLKTRTVAALTGDPPAARIVNPLWPDGDELGHAKDEVIWAIQHGTLEDVEEAVLEYGILREELSR